MEAVVAAAAHVDDGARSPAVAAKMTTAEAATAAEAPATVVSTTEAARVSTAEASAAKVASTEPTSAEMAAPAAAAEVAAEGGCVGRRKHADRNRDGGGSEHGLECLADHGTLQCIAERPVRFGH